MVGEPTLVEPVEKDPTLAASEESEKIGKEDDILTTPPDIWSAEYPDGGTRAWLIVFGGACTTFSTFGLVNAWGVFQSYYTETLLKDSSPSDIAWIGSIQYALIFIPGVASGHYFDRGYHRIPFFIASAVLVAATFLVGQCTQYWHFLLCQGLVTGISAGIVYGPITAVLGHWFKKRRGIAIGVLATGSSIGGTIFPIVARNLIPRVGFPWTLRIIGFILLFSLGCANLTVRRRLPPKHVAGGLLNPAAFKNPAYTIYCISGIIAFFGLYTVLTYIDVSATFVGISPEFSFYLISMANGASLFGRLTAGVTTDKLGAVNVIVPFSAVAAIMTYVWLLARSKGSFVAVAIIYGFSSGAYVSSFMLPMFHLGDIADVGRRSGMAVTLTGLGALVGPPISGAINTASGGYSAVGYYAGSMIFASIALMLVTRHLVLGKIWGKF
ncbi:major facilitator superfamily domain-containing protein [Mycena albidolilacea]|uniref:Major facilitator superfamily domain-containing protein n=1 Tax=Mycena albidolilacea TaxID=1033008 RepID=A0AAD7EUX7_9AGAR|nr:major facilitator superfamily domain-containing protein [Mycena albidolilacea]